MRIIKKLADQMVDEVAGMTEYIKEAINLKAVDPELSKMYYEMAKDEQRHMEKLHDQAEKKIKEARDKFGEPPQKMLNKWEDLHRKIIADAADAKMYMELYER